MPRKSQRSQISLSPSQRTLLQQTLEEAFGECNINLDEQVNNLVRYIVNRAGEHVSFKRAEIKKNVLSTTPGQYFQEVIDQAAKILKNVYGYNMIVVDAAKNISKDYIISNALPYVKDPTENMNGEEYPKDVRKILLMLILSHILMSNNSVSEVSLHSFLKSLNIDVERRHELFGHVKDYINNTLKNKKYLNVEMDQISKKLTFSWGPRAEKEISKHEVLNFICKVYKDRLPNSWVNQYKAAEQQGFENHKDLNRDT